MKKLTEMQGEVFGYITRFIKANGYPPTRAEIARYFDIWPNAAQGHVDALERAGCIKRSHGVSRGIKVLSL